MSRSPGPNRWSALDRDLGRVSTLEAASSHSLRPFIGGGLAILFLTVVALVAAATVGISSGSIAILAASVFAAYMAMNIGANDVANNMGPAVGARALTMTGAIAIAAICETAGALIGGREVITTVSRGIIDGPAFAEPRLYTLALLSAMLGGAFWMNAATLIGAPVSTTHAVLGALIGAGVTAAGLGAVHWDHLAVIALSWVLSPLAGGLLAAGILAVVQRTMLDPEDKIAAARRWVPVLIGVTAGTFTLYLVVKGLPHQAPAASRRELAIAILFGLAAWLAARPLVRRQAQGLANRKKSLKVLFRLPLIVSAAILSFAHGANDVANAVGPLAAIAHVTAQGHADAQVDFPFWVMLIGGLGISAGLILFGPRLVRLVGDEITRLNPPRACCVALAAGIVVLLASWAGLPVSTTHVAIGGIFGVGFFREWDHERRLARARSGPGRLPAEERRRRRLVRRSHFLTIVAAWIVTVPAAALLAALTFLVLNLLAG
ncbi:inorganic phosphate transporter [Mangrovicoccus algicola]|uniref:Phosphate transporter n=1 Tax=Mangrovicoccus algicola TaxID=2771008 RepID=A0A8J6Z9J9_9RHOB|nr:inorganic phosphate transporter [Mangrovicoccus algicola]MBE3640554.1 inorganic phosphate transporter [Mangrovicoccus algicola]